MSEVEDGELTEPEGEGMEWTKKWIYGMIVQKVVSKKDCINTSVIIFCWNIVRFNQVCIVVIIICRIFKRVKFFAIKF